MKANQAELVNALVVFLSGRPDDLAQLFALSGIAPQELRARLSDEGFQSGVLDYVMANEPLLLAFCEESGQDPAKITAMIARLSAPADPMGDWH